MEDQEGLMPDSVLVKLEMPANSSRAGRVPQIGQEPLQTAVLFPKFLPTVLDTPWPLQHYTDKHGAFRMMIMAQEMKGVGVLVEETPINTKIKVKPFTSIQILGNITKFTGKRELTEECGKAFNHKLNTSEPSVEYLKSIASSIQKDDYYLKDLEREDSAALSSSVISTLFRKNLFLSMVSLAAEK
ncbi:hypothetical protein U0070_002066, partial [Myodes glareolus]